jgi:hypothetical protein
MTSPETLNTKIVVKELRFSLVTHMTLSEEQFGSYGLLKTEQGAELRRAELIGD